MSPGALFEGVVLVLVLTQAAGQALSDLTFTDVGMDYVSLSWTAPADLNITGYRVSYQYSGGPQTGLNPPPAPEDTTATVQGLYAGVEYTFTVTSLGEDGEENGEISGTATTAAAVLNTACDQGTMELSIPIAALPGVIVTSMHLLDPRCGATITPTHVILSTHLLECGTIRQTLADKFTFVNKAIATPVVSENGAIRGRNFSRSFQCEFIRRFDITQRREVLYNIPPPSVPIEIEGGNNSLIISMNMFTSADFSDKFDSVDFPLQVTPADRLHFGLGVDSPLDNLELFALQCVATPTLNPDDSPRVSIIQDGCNIDPTLEKNDARSGEKALYYSVQAFTLPNAGDNSLLYIHCTMLVCFEDDSDSRCSEGCVPARGRRQAGSVTGEHRVRRESGKEHDVKISQGPIITKTGKEKETGSTFPTVGVAVGAVGVLTGVLMLIATVVLVRMRPGLVTRKTAKDRAGLDNYSFQVWGKRKPNVPSPDTQ
ncbi:OIT3 [Branchiostoma lanceolatum]|uniref:OIT3 protein n=1 Tax=Branchiostoma lanceolatum TaxID=7740 RepID=A0A8J9ZIR8_BRALA|nr:OIT3 [Branchiostoma lanceolatum]